MNEPPLIDDFRPLSLLRPATVAELGEIVRRAAAEGHALYPVGGATMLHLGNPPAKPGHAVDLRGLDQVIDYPARDMTITVQAGISIAKLQEILAKENQRLPIDVPQPERATLGGAIAVNASGPRRYGFGTLRDYVIGISFTDDAGNEVKAGGRVVKNVAGYDLCKLQIGALGTLGIVTQVTLKVLPAPERSAVVLLEGSEPRTRKIEDIVAKLNDSAVRPTCLSALSEAAMDAIGGKFPRPRFLSAVAVGFEHSGEAVEWQVEQLKATYAELSRPALSHIDEIPTLRDTDADAFWRGYTGASAFPNSPFAFKVVVPSSAACYLCAIVASLDWEAPWFVQVGNGILLGRFKDEMPPDEQVRKIRALRDVAREHGGNLIVTRCPSALKRELMVWGESRGDWALMRKVKRELDPRDIFNPGRFVV